MMFLNRFLSQNSLFRVKNTPKRDVITVFLAFFGRFWGLKLFQLFQLFHFFMLKQ